MTPNPTPRLNEARDLIAIIAAVSSAAAALVARPQWPTIALIVMVVVMGYVIWRMLSATLHRMQQDLQQCREAHAECSERFQQVLDLLVQREARARKRRKADKSGA